MVSLCRRGWLSPPNTIRLILVWRTKHAVASMRSRSLASDWAKRRMGASTRNGSCDGTTATAIPSANRGLNRSESRLRAQMRPSFRAVMMRVARTALRSCRSDFSSCPAISVKPFLSAYASRPCASSSSACDRYGPMSSIIAPGWLKPRGRGMVFCACPPRGKHSSCTKGLYRAQPFCVKRYTINGYSTKSV